MDRTSSTVGQPVVILTGLPYSMTWDDVDDLEDKEGVVVRIDKEQREGDEPLPYEVQLAEGGEPVWAQQVLPVADPARALDIARQVARHLAERSASLTVDLFGYRVAAHARIAEIEILLERDDLPGAVRADLQKLLSRH